MYATFVAARTGIGDLEMSMADASLRIAPRPMVIAGIRADGQKELLATEEGYGERTSSRERCCAR
jgi:hypothetical protein